jgi:hypothetical protein
VHSFININPLWGNNRRHSFLKDLNLKPMRLHMNERHTISNLPRNWKIMIKELCKIEHSPPKSSSWFGKKMQLLPPA